MGEYILLDGVPVKIGTCENLYYCRYTDLVEWIDAGRAGYMTGNAQPARYLTGGYRFRFPFPDEDGPEHARLATYAAVIFRGVLLPYPPDLLTADIVHGYAHADFLPYMRERTAGYPLRAIRAVTCPLDAAVRAERMTPEFQTLASADQFGNRRYVSGGPWVELVQQRPTDGMLWAVFCCPWCGTRWRVDRKDAERIAASALTTAPELELGELMGRMLAGYDGLPGRPVSFAEPGGA